MVTGAGPTEGWGHDKVAGDLGTLNWLDASPGVPWISVVIADGKRMERAERTVDAAEIHDSSRIFQFSSFVADRDPAKVSPQF